MKKSLVLLGISGLLAAVLFSCSDKGTSNNSGPKVLDTSVNGQWHGEMGAIQMVHFNGEKIFAHFSGDSTFSLITRDTTRVATPGIFDTTLVLNGTWRLNTPKDSVLLLLDTCRIIDTTQNMLVPRLVRGQTIPVFVSIAKNPDDGYIEWQIVLTDFVPLAPLLGLDLSNVPKSLLQVIKIVLAKTSQE
jgi:hypothetical protein